MASAKLNRTDASHLKVKVTSNKEDSLDCAGNIDLSSAGSPFRVEEADAYSC